MVELLSSPYHDHTWLAKEEKPSSLVPKTLIENLEWRRDVLSWSCASQEARQLLFDACTRDPVFFCNTFIWAKDVRRYPNSPNRPVILWPFQEELYLDIHNAIGRRSIGVLKSRDNGGTLVPLINFDWYLFFTEDTGLLVMSRNEKKVDNPKDPNSLFSKLDYFHRWMPTWMTEPLERSELSYVNRRTRSNILGASTTSDASRGDRMHAAFVDEHAAFERKLSIEVLGSLEHATKCRIYVSTSQGVGNGFHQVITGGGIKVHRLSWQKHPIHRAGLYTSEKGVLKVLDKEFWRWASNNTILRLYPEMDRKLEPSDDLAYGGYPWILDGKIRSPYYDHACVVCPIPRLIAQELDMDFVGSGSLFYDADMIREYVQLFAKEPQHIGEMTYEPDDDDSAKWAEQKSGRMFLWFNPDEQGRPPADRTFSMAADVSAGSGASNSRLSIGDNTMRCLCASMTTPHLRPERLAEYANAVGRWFNNAKIIFEGTGLGSDFGARLVELKYPNLHWEEKVRGGKSERPGWYPTEDTKRNLLTEYGDALARRTFTNPDSVAVLECLMYEWTENQRVVHSEALSSLLADPSGAKKNHGDRVSGDAQLWKLMKRTVAAQAEEIVPQDSFAAMMKESGRHQLRENQWWKSSDPPRRWSNRH